MNTRVPAVPFLRHALVLLALLSLVVLPALPAGAGSGPAGWGVSGGDGANTKQGSTLAPSDPGLKWLTDLSHSTLSTHHDSAQALVLTADGKVLVRINDGRVDGDTVTLLALDPDDGEIAWERTWLGRACAPAVAADGTIWVTQELNEDTRQPGDEEQATAALVALDPATGAPIDGKRSTGTAETPLEGCSNSIQIAPDGTVLLLAAAGSQGMFLQGFDPATGARQWATLMKTATSGAAWRVTTRFAVAPSGSPGAGSAYIAVHELTYAPELLKIDVATGDVVDRFALPGDTRPSAPDEVVADGSGGVTVHSVDDDYTYWNRVQDTAAGFDHAAGWEQQVTGDDFRKRDRIRTHPQAMGLSGDVIIGTYAESWFGVGVDDGSFRFDLPMPGGLALDTMAIDSAGNILSGSFGGPTLWSFTPEGQVRWSTRPDALGVGGAAYVVGPITQDPATGERVVYVAHHQQSGDNLHIAAIDNSGGLIDREDDDEVPDRISGEDRFETAVDISRSFVEPGGPVVYVATGRDFPDALAGGVPAALDRAPVLLVTRDGIPAKTAEELSRLQPGRIVVFGGPAAVSEAVRTQLRSYTSGTVTRVSGDNRYETAAEISKSKFSPTTDRNLSVFVATGTNFPDALAGVPPAAAHEGPILLVTRDGLPKATSDELGRLSPHTIFVLGGPGAVSQTVFNQLRGHATEVIRVSGDNRFDTAVEVGGLVTGQDPPDPLTVFVATGQNYPDALSGGAVAGAIPGPIFLVSSNAAPQVVLDEIGRLRPDRLIIFGGTSAVSQQVENQLRARMGG